MDIFGAMISELLAAIGSIFRNDDASEDQRGATARDIWHTGLLLTGIILLVVAVVLYFAA